AVDCAREPEPELEAGGVGSAAKETVTAKGGSFSGQPPLPPLPPPAAPPREVDFVELCRETWPTPSIRRRRCRVCATSAWLVAHPASMKVGTLPGGVAEAPARGDRAGRAALAPALGAGVVGWAGAPAAAVAEPMVPL